MIEQKFLKEIGVELKYVCNCNAVKHPSNEREATSCKYWEKCKFVKTGLIKAEHREKLMNLVVSYKFTNYFSFKKASGGYYCQWLPMGQESISEWGKTIQEALYELLIKLRDKKIITNKEIKECLK